MIAILRYAILKSLRDRSLPIFAGTPAVMALAILLGTTLADRRLVYPLYIHRGWSLAQNALPHYFALRAKAKLSKINALQSGNNSLQDLPQHLNSMEEAVHWTERFLRVPCSPCGFRKSSSRRSRARRCRWLPSIVRRSACCRAPPRSSTSLISSHWLSRIGAT